MRLSKTKTIGNSSNPFCKSRATNTIIQSNHPNKSTGLTSFTTWVYGAGNATINIAIAAICMINFDIITPLFPSSLP